MGSNMDPGKNVTITSCVAGDQFFTASNLCASQVYSLKYLKEENITTSGGQNIKPRTVNDGKTT